jgi:hypothetical protein
MKRVLIACAIVGLCAWLPLSAQSEVGYRANIGRTAVSAATGAELGPIVEVAMMNGIWVYKVRREGQIVNAPVHTIVARDKERAAPPKPVKAPPAVAAEGTIEPLLQRTAVAFREQLARHESTLQALLITPKGISARWSSPKCDYFESELIDLLLSIKRTQTASSAVTGTHTCVGKMRGFTVTGDTFHKYRTGEIDEAKVLAAVK